MRMYKYEKIAEDLTKKVKKGEITHRLPTYRQLVQDYNCSSRTIDQVLELLKSDGIIYTKLGKGIYVK